MNFIQRAAGAPLAPVGVAVADTGTVRAYEFLESERTPTGASKGRGPGVNRGPGAAIGRTGQNE